MVLMLVLVNAPEIQRAKPGANEWEKREALLHCCERIAAMRILRQIFAVQRPLRSGSVVRCFLG